VAEISQRGWLYQRMDAETGNELQPTGVRRYARTCSGCDEDEHIVLY